MKLTPLIGFAVLSASLLAVQASTPSPTDSTLEARRGGGGGGGFGRGLGRTFDSPVRVPDTGFSLPWLRNGWNFFSAQNWSHLWGTCPRKATQPEFDQGWLYHRKRAEMTSEVEATLVTKQQPVTLIREDALLPRRLGSGGVQVIDLNLSRNFLNAFRYESPSYCPWWWCPNSLDDDIEDLRVLQKLSKRESSGLKTDEEAQQVDYQSNDSQAAAGSLSASPVYDEGGDADGAQADSDELDTYENIAKRLDYDSSRDEDESARGVQAAKADVESDGLETKDTGSSPISAEDAYHLTPVAEYAVGLAG